MERIKQRLKRRAIILLAILTIFCWGTRPGSALQILVAQLGGTGQSTVTAGDLLIGGTNVWNKLGIGSSTNVLTVSGGLPSWQAPAAAAVIIPSRNELRLTLSSTKPVFDVAASTTLYLLPFAGTHIALYTGSAWVDDAVGSGGVSIAIPATTNTTYDVWAYDVSGTVNLELLVWTTRYVRATALAYQDGIPSKTGALTRRYIGTISTNGTSGNCQDDVTKRFVYNQYNAVTRPMRFVDTAARTLGASYAEIGSVEFSWINGGASFGQTTNVYLVACGEAKTQAAVAMFAILTDSSGSLGVPTACYQAAIDNGDTVGQTQTLVSTWTGNVDTGLNAGFNRACAGGKNILTEPNGSDGSRTNLIGIVTQ